MSPAEVTERQLDVSYLRLLHVTPSAFLAFTLNRDTGEGAAPHYIGVTARLTTAVAAELRTYHHTMTSLL